MKKKNLTLFLILLSFSCKGKIIEYDRSQGEVKLYPISVNRKWGYIDKTDKIVIEP
jgi:hypothetical protein